MIKKYIFGKPLLKTYAVIEEVKAGEKLPYFQITHDHKIRFTCPLEEKDLVFGLGENTRGINKRPGLYISYNSDNPHHRDNTPSLYASHNFFVLDGRRHFGAFFDTPSKIKFEIDRNNSGEIKVSTANQNLEVYIIEGDDSYDISRQFLKIIGQSFLPPLWAFGFGQSRWGYKDQKDFETVMEKHRENDLPLDWICMDIDYMDRFIDFTINKQRFPDMQGFVDKTRKRGIHLVPIIDAGVKIEPGDPTYDEGVKNGYFCTNKDGKFFKAAVWPGMTHFPDFFRPEVRQWFGQRYKVLTDLGFEGFWNDMNEPSIFYSEYNKLRSLWHLSLNFYFPHSQDKAVDNDKKHDYHCFFNEVNGQKVKHHLVHNLYGGYMTMAASEELQKLLDRRFLLFSRSSYIGAHRYGGIWTGDNESLWEHLKLNICQMPGLNMCGFLYSGADTGGFGGKCDRELLLRWLAFSAFTPLMRNHAEKGSRRQECYSFGDTADFKSILDFRYHLIPYLYSEFMKAALNHDLLFKPLSFVFKDDERVRTIEDQLIVGDSIMVTPVIEKGATGRKVYLPQPMTEVRYDGKEFRCQKVEKGEREIKVALNEIVFYILKDKCLPIGKAARNTSELDLKDVYLLGDGKTYQQYLDDGYSRNVCPEKIRTINNK